MARRPHGAIHAAPALDCPPASTVTGPAMEMLAFLLLGATVGWLVATVRRLGAAPGDTQDAPPAPIDNAAAAPPEGDAPATADADARRIHVRAGELARALADNLERMERPEELDDEPAFAELRALLALPPFDAQERLNRALAQNTALSCAAIAAMRDAGDDRRAELARLTPRMGSFAAAHTLRYLADSIDPTVLGLLLLHAPDWWGEHPGTRARLLALLERQRELGVTPALPADENFADIDFDRRREQWRTLAHPLVEAFAPELERAARRHRGQRELAQVARPLAADDGVLAHVDTMDAAIAQVVELLQRTARPSLVLLGAEGAGKTTIARAALRSLQAQGWRVFEATPAQVGAGQKYLGELEQRVQNLVDGLAGERTVWFVPDLHQLLEQGAWSGNPRGVLDLLVPHLEAGRVQLLGESSVAAWSRVLTQRPRVDGLITGLRVEGLGEADTRALARDWGRQWSGRLGEDVLPDAIADEAAELARQQFPERAEPGRTLQLLQEALDDARATQPPALPLDRERLLGALARTSGLPLEILDNARRLDVDAVRAYFAARVIGQDEAVDSLVDRIVMLKAGLTDPRRPIGVFLFAGPTGTGKTEIAKTLARFLFGSPDRMLRVDMSEYQSEDAYWRLIDEGAHGGASLVARVRQAPFSVVLLDEFEKAHPKVWDLFLQVFDDGRLTDKAGATADFRHTIIVLTSNLGAAIARGGGMGFTARDSGFSRELVDRAIAATFRPEFVNRLDRVVVFNPLTRALMRDILRKELAEVLGRRGFRGRAWAVEWEPSAVEFLLDRGFTPDLGARPLRRAIDRYLLAPLARTIVEHRVPHGEQFLFVEGDGDALRVRFVDPDAPVAEPAPTTAAPADLRALALDPRADASALALLEGAIAALRARVEAPEWGALKADAAWSMQAADFWQRPERRAVLDRLERIDRIEAGVGSASGLRARLGRSAGRGAGEVARRLALLVAALDAAIEAVLDGSPEDARLELRPADARARGNLAWRDRLAAMYAAWGQARGMRVRVHPADAQGVVRIELSGYAAWTSLRREAGLHVLETREGDAEARHSVRVAVHADPAAPEATVPADADTRICRRYDDGPSPLVRDTVRGWRSGRLDRVLAGDFDLIGSE